MKKTKIIIPALGMLLLSTAASVTGTVAWFAMNESVTATGMQVKAVAEDGILICNELDADSVTNWKKSTSASYGTTAELAPTSTADLSAWYHNSSDDQTDAKAGQVASTYEVLSSKSGWMRDEGANKSGAYFLNIGEGTTLDNTEKAYVLLNEFYIKASGSAIEVGATKTYKALYINKVAVTGASGTTGLDASLRIGVKISSNVNIYAPVAGATASYKVGGGDTGTDVSATVVPTHGIVNTAQTSITAIPAITTAKASTIKASVFIWFEGEDAGLKSANLAATLDTLSVTVQFGITQAEVPNP